jgi:hypothetical protein
MRKPDWKKEEFASLLETLRRSGRLQDAVRAHNDLWKSNRTVDSIQRKLEREGKGSAGNFLRIEAQRGEDLPIQDQVKRLVDLLRRRPDAGVADLCNSLDIAPQRLNKLVSCARAMDYRVEMPTNDRVTLNVKAPPIDRLAVHRLPIEPIKGHLRFAVASDLHFASKLHRRECLEDFLQLAYYDHGIRTVLVPGDIFAGQNMYRGQLNEVVCWAMEGQLAEAVDGLPRFKGLTYHAIGGNHDESFMKATGGDVIAALGKARDDVKTYGFYSALLDLAAPGAKRAVKVEMHHPDKAGAYALSYHLQKEIEQIPPGMKPQLLFMGHTHTSVMVPDYRSVAAFYCGTFEDQTLFLKRKHLAPAIGGWFVDCGVAADGSLRTLKVTWVKYYHSARGSIPGLDLDHFGKPREVRFSRSLGAP